MDYRKLAVDDLNARLKELRNAKGTKAYSGCMRGAVTRYRVLGALAGTPGASTKELAATLGLAPSTIRDILCDVAAKLDHDSDRKKGALAELDFDNLVFSGGYDEHAD